MFDKPHMPLSYLINLQYWPQTPTCREYVSLLALPVAVISNSMQKEKAWRAGGVLAPEAIVPLWLGVEICTDSEEQIDNFYQVAYLS
jgi:hypothetical protein